MRWIETAFMWPLLSNALLAPTAGASLYRGTTRRKGSSASLVLSYQFRRGTVLNEAAEAIRYVETERARGKVVTTIPSAPNA